MKLNEEKTLAGSERSDGRKPEIGREERSRSRIRGRFVLPFRVRLANTKQPARRHVQKEEKRKRRKKKSWQAH